MIWISQVAVNVVNDGMVVCSGISNFCSARLNLFNMIHILFSIKNSFHYKRLIGVGWKNICLMIKFVYKFTFDAKVFTPDVSLYTKNMQSLFSNDE